MQTLGCQRRLLPVHAARGQWGQERQPERRPPRPQGRPHASSPRQRATRASGGRRPRGNGAGRGGARGGGEARTRERRRPRLAGGEESARGCGRPSLRAPAAPTRLSRAFPTVRPPGLARWLTLRPGPSRLLEAAELRSAARGAWRQQKILNVMGRKLPRRATLPAPQT